MVRSFLTLSLLMSGTVLVLPTSGCASSVPQQPHYLKTPYAELDGKFNIEPVYHLSQYLASVLAYDFNQNPDNPCTLHNLAQREASQDPIKVQRLLQRCITAFVQKLHEGDHIKGIWAIRGVVDRLIEVWAKERGLQDSTFFLFCKAWKQPGTEIELLNETITSIAEYEQFMLDFHLFLIDVLYSFPKSRAALVEQ